MTTKTKAELAQVIYTEVNGVRKDFIERAMSELNMSKAGASTYFSNAKTRASGEKVKSYSTYSKKEAKVVDIVDDSKEDAKLFEVVVGDTTHCFMSQQALDEFTQTIK